MNRNHRNACSRLGDPSPRCLSLSLAALLAAGLNAQTNDPPKEDRAVQAALADGKLGRLVDSAARVFVDRPRAGQVWVAGTGYKAGFDAGGLTFVTTPGRTIPGQRFGARLAGIAIDGHALPLGAAKLSASERSVDLDHGPVVESYRLAQEHVEQTFVFAALPHRGAIEITVDVATAPAVRVDEAPASFDFIDGTGNGVRYGRAVAIDGAGRRLDLDTRCADGRIRIAVPASFVATARLPLVVDPIIGAIVQVSTNAQQEREPDVAYDATNNRWVIVWQRDVSPTDSDVWSVELDANLQIVPGSLTPIDISTDCWERPKVANNRAAARHLVVAQRSVGRASPFAIWGRSLDAGTHAVSPVLAIADATQPGHAAGDKYSPDVGGDPSGDGNSYFTVVWQRETTPLDHDIHAKQVTNEAMPRLRNAAPTVIDDSPAFEFFPTISKSNGNGPRATQRWFIGYVRQRQATDWDIHGSTMTWDGLLPPAPNFLVEGSADNDHNPTVSSPTDDAGGTRFALYAWERGLPGATRIQGIVFDQGLGGAMPAARSPSTDLSLLDGAPLIRSPREPSADSDGVRFAVAYTETYSGSDIDTRISTFHHLVGAGATGAIGVSDPRGILGYSTSAEQAPEISSVHSGGGPALLYCATWDDQRGTSPDAIEAVRYEGRGATAFVRFGSGCNGLSLASSGVPALGAPLNFAVQGRTGLAAVILGFTHPGVTLCGSCTWLVEGIAFADPLAVLVPMDPTFIGVQIAAQGLDVNAGVCGPIQADLRFTEAVMFTIR